MEISNLGEGNWLLNKMPLAETKSLFNCDAARTYNVDFYAPTP